MNFEKLQETCKASKKKATLNETDVKAVYLLWNDPKYARSRLLSELKHSEKTMNKIDKFIKTYMQENKLKELKEELYALIADKYNKG